MKGDGKKKEAVRREILDQLDSQVDPVHVVAFHEAMRQATIMARLSRQRPGQIVQIATCEVV